MGGGFEWKPCSQGLPMTQCRTLGSIVRERPQMCSVPGPIGPRILLPKLICDHVGRVSVRIAPGYSGWRHRYPRGDIRSISPEGISGILETSLRADLGQGCRGRVPLLGVAGGLWGNKAVASTKASPRMTWMSLARPRIDVETNWGSSASLVGMPSE